MYFVSKMCAMKRLLSALDDNDSLNTDNAAAASSSMFVYAHL